MKLRIKELAKVQGLTITAMAEKAGVTQATLSNTVNEKSKPSFEVLEKVAEVLGVELWELFTESLVKGDVNGYIEVKGDIYKVSSKEDIEKVLDRIPVRNAIDKDEVINNLIASAQIEGITLSREKAEKMWEKAISKNGLPQ